MGREVFTAYACFRKSSFLWCAFMQAIRKARHAAKEVRKMSSATANKFTQLQSSPTAINQTQSTTNVQCMQPLVQQPTVPQHQMQPSAYRDARNPQQQINIHL